MDLGFVKNSLITTALISPSKGLRAFEIKNTIIAIRDEDSSKITIYY